MPKLTIDGSPQGFTAWRDQPYYKPVGNYPTGAMVKIFIDESSLRERWTCGLFYLSKIFFRFVECLFRVNCSGQN